MLVEQLTSVWLHCCPPQIVLARAQLTPSSETKGKSPPLWLVLGVPLELRRSTSASPTTMSSTSSDVSSYGTGGGGGWMGGPSTCSSDGWARWG